ncbi:MULTISPECIES: TIGR02281 family clan AA aspartic protease [Rhizobiaceae]|jgi:aspartyl protease family protein|uniref:Aspartyl protease family protein n=1 Tax=Aliirhizobium cellulosilyticum TaxID=393664 RepID=A0A7W4SIX6_9HYPH|nr:TIGR02281 family clan AA aspartic protease [Rhizobium cellulosilyticum]MBB4349027.1 aspartyl protease family protein [Rhizobium cellulosilyticum]MBB4412752.1 aspartyl protease family protein [Rhizobium cellulosilyticum]MBB4447384.1 aspartyl protease family protein [Rhizobium cellulosilyticum]
MLIRTAMFAAVAVVVATQIPALLEHTGPAQQEPVVQAPAAKSQVATTPQAASLTPGTMVLNADGRGHFIGTFKLNGKSVTGLVDTGASVVAINERTARMLGYGANSLDFRYPMQTANGQTLAAHVVLDRVEIGNVRVRDVDAMVLRDEALSTTLVGMSFLTKLKSYQVKGGSLTLAN